VVSISNKSDGEQILATEFNQILAVVDELYNSSGNFGIGVAPTSGVALDVDGILKLEPMDIGGSSCSEEGELAFDGSSKHLYGCSAGTWKQLDNDSCTLNGCEEETCTTATCDNGCDPVAPGTKTCEVTCSSNTDCDEPNPCTDDTCSNQGETNSSCSHSNNTDSTSCSQLFGTCTATDGTKTCSEGSYGACTGATDPRPTTCSGKDCGSDGCGGTCGTCTAPKTCNASGTCETACTPVDGAWSSYGPWTCDGFIGPLKQDDPLYVPIGTLLENNLQANLFAVLSLESITISRSRSRTCTNPTPSCEGLICAGSATQTESCGTNEICSDGACNSVGCTTAADCPSPEQVYGWSCQYYISTCKGNNCGVAIEYSASGTSCTNGSGETGTCDGSGTCDVDSATQSTTTTQ